MPFYYYFLIPVLLIIVALVIRYLGGKRKNIPVELFTRALRDENSGEYAAAVISYENALLEFKKRKRYNSQLEYKIMEKLKVLHTMIDYEKNFQSRK